MILPIFFADRFKNLSGISLSEDEISLFAIHFIRAMETNLGRTEQRVGLINPYGKQIKELMVKRLGIWRVPFSDCLYLVCL